MVGLGIQVHTINELNKTIEEMEKDMELLKQDKINLNAEKESISHQLDILENEHRQKLDELETQLEERDSQIEQLKEDLVAKKEREARLAKEKKEDSSDNTNEKKVATASNNVKSNNNLGTFTVTFYSVGDGLTPSTVTANGTDVSNTIYSPEGYRIIAVDTRVIPMNSIVEVTMSGSTFTAKASDSGSAIKGNKIDLLVSSPDEALRLGVQKATLNIIK